MQVHVEAIGRSFGMTHEMLDAIQAARAAKKNLALIRFLDSHARALVVEGNVVLGDIDEATMSQVDKLLRQDRSRAIESEYGRVFVQILNPPLRLTIVGAVHIAQALAPMAALVGYAVTIVDPRGAFATEDRFPGVSLLDDWPDEAMEQLAPDRRTAVVTLTHDPKLDDPALDVALRSEAFYIAALGSRRTHAGRIERLKALGHDDETIARIHGPAGLDIGAVSPPEIALSIMAQMTATLRRSRE